MPQVLFYADAHALAAYLGGAALLQPDLAAARCEALTLAQSEGAAEPSRALYFEGQPELPTPADSAHGTSLFQGDLDRGAGELTVRMGRGRRRQRLKLVGGATGARELAQVLPPTPWPGGAPDVDEVLFLCPPGEPFARIVSQHLELGRNALSYAPVETSDGSRMLLEVLEPSWFLLERWLARGEDGVQVYRRLSGTFGPRRVYVEWGYEHALETWLADPADEGQLLLIDRRGTHRTLQRQDLKDVGQVLRLDPTLFATERLSPSEEPEPIEVSMRLEGRVTPRDPELWILPVSQRRRLEELLAQTPEEELRNLMVACVSASTGGDGSRLFVVREVLTGRAPRLLPLGERAYAPIQGLPNLLVPCSSALAPALSNDRYSRAFGLRSGELTILDALDSGEIAATKIGESAFRPVEAIVEFVIADHAQEVEAVMLDVPFDLGRFAEEDLVPRQRTRAKTPVEKQVPRVEPSGKKAEKAPRKPGLIDTLLKPFRSPAGGTTKQPRKRQESDPRRKEIARVQRELVLDEATADRWLELSRLLFEDGQEDEAVRSLEHSVWMRERTEATRHLELLEDLLGEPELGAPAKDTLELFRRVLSYRHEIEQTGTDVERYRSATEGVYGDLREQEDRLRKRTRWLLWRAVLEQTGDAIEVERQREAILSDLVVRGIEEREVPAFIRHTLLEHYGQKAATGSGANAALAFLDRAHRFAGTTLKHPAFCAEALAHVAWAFAELGQGDRALAIAAEAERAAASKEGAPPHTAGRVRAVARAGAVYERIRGHDAGRRQLEQALAEITRLLPSEPLPRRKSQEMVDARKALVSWLSSVADAWASAERSGDRLLRQAIALISTRSPNDLSQIVHDAHSALTRLGLGGEVRTLALGLLGGAALERARNSVLDHQHPDAAYRFHVQNVVETLELYRGGEAVSQEESRGIMDLFRAHPQLIDEFSIGPLRIALRGNPASPWTVVEGLVADLLQRGLAYEAQLVRIAALWRFAELRERGRGADLLESVFADAWKLPESPQKKPSHRVLTRLVQLIPAFGMRERGLRLLHEVNELTQQRSEAGVYFRNELLTSTALAGSKLGDSRAAFELIQETAKLAISDFEKASQSRRMGDQRWLLFETLDECVNGTVDLGDPRRGLALVADVGETARGALAQTREGPGSSEGPYFYCRTLIGCGRAALALGDSDAATGHFGAAFAYFHSLRSWDQTDILREAAETAGQLEGGRRYQLALQVIEQAEAPVAGGNQDRFGRDLVAQIAADMVRGESAFASAIKRWKGREERAIRDLVAHEQVVAED
jgi:hypothetical protein